MRFPNPTYVRSVGRFTLACCFGLALSGCISSPKAIRQESRTMLDIYRNAIDSEPKARGTAQNNKPPALALEKTAVVDNAKLATDRDAKLYKAKFGDTESQQDNHGKPPLHATFTRHAKNEIKQLFPRLPNPDILIYVYPHLATAEQVPIPGYTTAMPLYERVHYAMPGDFIPARRSEQHALPAHQSVRP